MSSRLVLNIGGLYAILSSVEPWLTYGVVLLAINYEYELWNEARRWAHTK